MSRSNVHTFRGWADEDGVHLNVQAFKSACAELGRFVVMIMPPEQAYTQKQRALYWIWVREASAQTGYTHSETDTRFRAEYGHDKLFSIIHQNGEAIRERLSLRTLSREEMSDYMNNIYYGELDKGVILSQNERTL